MDTLDTIKAAASRLENSQQQCDDTGEMISVSRRALDETLAAIESLRPEAVDTPAAGEVGGWSMMLVATDDERQSWITQCKDDEALLAAVRREVFASEALDADEEQQAVEIRNELLECGAWFPEGDQPLYLFKFGKPIRRLTTPQAAAAPVDGCRAALQLCHDALMKYAETGQPPYADFNKAMEAAWTALGLDAAPTREAAPERMTPVSQHNASCNLYNAEAAHGDCTCGRAKQPEAAHGEQGDAMRGYVMVSFWMNRQQHRAKVLDAPTLTASIAALRTASHTHHDDRIALHAEPGEPSRPLGDHEAVILARDGSTEFYSYPRSITGG